MKRKNPCVYLEKACLCSTLVLKYIYQIAAPASWVTIFLSSRAGLVATIQILSDRKLEGNLADFFVSFPSTTNKRVSRQINIKWVRF